MFFVILKTIRARRWNMIEHILRHENELIYRTMEGGIEGRGTEDDKEHYL